MQKKAFLLIKILKKSGYLAYFAGGSVRDMLLGRNPSDFDIVTSAKPSEVEKLLKKYYIKTIPVGKKFGVILAIVNGYNFEIATFRGEEGYTDSRRPDKIFYTTAKKDALRRDFTINGLFYDPIEKKVLDYVGGKTDLEYRVLRFIGNPDTRIKEDHLRILRAIRIKNVLGFRYDKKTWISVVNNASSIATVSGERLRDELNKMLTNRNRVLALKDLSSSGVLKYILPELEEMKGVEQPDNFHKEGDVWTHTLLALSKIHKNVSLDVVWAVLLHDIGKPKTSALREGRITFYRHTKVGAEITEKMLRRLRFPRTRIEKIVWLVKNHLRFKDIKFMKVARQRRFLQHPYFADLLEVSWADSQSSYPVTMELYNNARKLYDEEQKKPKPPKRLLSGTEIMNKFGVPEGPKVGKLLDDIIEAQLEEKIETKKDALEFVEKSLKNNIKFL